MSVEIINWCRTHRSSSEDGLTCNIAELADSVQRSQQRGGIWYGVNCELEVMQLVPPDDGEPFFAANGEKGFGSVPGVSPPPSTPAAVVDAMLTSTEEPE